jgi:hypothetical protein
MATMGAAAFVNAPAETGAAPLAGQVPSGTPVAGGVWMAGQWISNGGQWRWEASHWEVPPARNASWVAGHWAAQDGSWVWVNGAWNVGDEPAASAVPPAPPAVQPTGASAVEPSTPAPTVEAVYGPDGVERVPDTSVVEPYYGPVDYVPTYVDYGPWASYPGYWGFGGAYIDLGWGGGHRGAWHRTGAPGGYRRGGIAPARGGRVNFSSRSGGHTH